MQFLFQYVLDWWNCIYFFNFILPRDLAVLCWNLNFMKSHLLSIIRNWFHQFQALILPSKWALFSVGQFDNNICNAALYICALGLLDFAMWISGILSLSNICVLLNLLIYFNDMDAPFTDINVVFKELRCDVVWLIFVNDKISIINSYLIYSSLYLIFLHIKYFHSCLIFCGERLFQTVLRHLISFNSSVSLF